jgi:hypothetical protein
VNEDHDRLRGKVAAVIAGNDHVLWLSMSEKERQTFYTKADQVILMVRSSDFGPKSDRKADE